MDAVILAGGEGRRLRPYTSVLPKPLMPVGDLPILEVILRQLKSAGLREITLSVGYLSSLIRAYCGDGEKFDLEISYVSETAPLGTAGPLQLLEAPNSAFIVMNGDVLTDLDFRALHKFHENNEQLLTIATFEKEVQIPLGVLELSEDGTIADYREKPTFYNPVSMGIYCCSPEILDYLPAGERFDLPDLVMALLADGQRVRSYPHPGYWLDIGNHEDYERAQYVVTEATKQDGD